MEFFCRDSTDATPRLKLPTVVADDAGVIS